MKLDELISRVKANAGPKLAGVPDEKARVLLRAAFAQIQKDIESAGEEPVRVIGLGTFRARVVQQQKDGKTETVRRVIYRAPEKKA